MIDDPFSDLLKTNKRKENISKLNDDLAYEILSVVEEIPAGRVFFVCVFMIFWKGEHQGFTSPFFSNLIYS